MNDWEWTQVHPACTHDKVPGLLRLRWKDNKTCDTVSKHVTLCQLSGLSATRLQYITDHGIGADRLRQLAQAFIHRDRNNIFVVDLCRTNEVDLCRTNEVDAREFQRWADHVLDILKESLDTVSSKVFECNQNTLPYVVRHLSYRLKFVRNISTFVRGSGTVQLIFQTDEQQFVERISGEAEEQSVIEDKECGHDQRELLILKSCVTTIKDSSVDLTFQNNTLTVSGLRGSVIDVLAEVRKRKRSYFVKQKTVPKELSLLFLDSNVVQYFSERIRDILPEDLEPWWEIKNDILNIACSDDRCVLLLDNTLTSSFGFWESDVVNGVLFQSNVWRRYLGCLDDMGFVGKFLINYNEDIRKVHIAATADVHLRVVNQVSQFLLRYQLKAELLQLSTAKIYFLLKVIKESVEQDLDEEFVRICQAPETGYVKVTGTRQGVDQVRQITKDIIVRRYWITDVSCVPQLQAHFRTGIGVWKDLRAAFSIHTNPVQLQVQKCLIEDLETDVIVNSCNQRFAPRLGFGSSSRAIAKKVGHACLDEIRGRFPNGLEIGQIADGNPGNLRCKKLYYVTFDQFHKEKFHKQLSTLRTVMMESLHTADDAGFKSIAFPALCTGHLHYPKDDVADAMFDVATAFFNSVPTSIKIILFVIHPENEVVYKVFKTELDRRLRQLEDSAKVSTAVLEQPTYPAVWYVDMVVEDQYKHKDAKQKLVDKLLLFN